jgi:TRAP-type C4-dicarboxylate transport system permease small subunit
VIIAFKSTLAVIASIERVTAGVAIGCLAVLLLGDVVAREVFHQSIPWAQKLALHLMILAGSVGVSLTSSGGGHIRPEVGDRLLPRTIMPAVTAFREICIAVFCGFYFHISRAYVLQSKEFGDINVVTGIPLWIIQAVFPGVFLLMAAKHIVFALLPATRPAPKGVV